MNETSDSPPAAFPTTQWTQIIEVIQQGGGESAQAALNEFCGRYRPAICNFCQRRGLNREDAEDCTQRFLSSQLLERARGSKGILLKASRNHSSRFRAFLATALLCFLKDDYKSRQSAKSGGKVRHVPLHESEAGVRVDGHEVPDSFGREFDRVFALEIIQRATERSRHSQHLLAHLKGEITQEEAARQLDMSEDAFKQAFFRFRKKLAKDLWDEVSKLAGPRKEDIQDEIRYLLSLFAEAEA